MLHRRTLEDVVIYDDKFFENWKGVSFDELLDSVELGISSKTFWKRTKFKPREKTEIVVTWWKQLRYELHTSKTMTLINITSLRPTYCWTNIQRIPL